MLTAACGSSAPEVGALDPQLVTTGGDLYAANCAQCHGEDLRGTDQGPSLLSQVYEPGHHADGAFLLAVQRGVQPHHWNFGPMPAVEGLNAEDVEAIVAFVRDWQQAEGFEPYP
jgi:mono/diheme cytochrome c family protein